MTTPSQTETPAWLRVLQFPLVRLLLLGGVLFGMMGVSGGLMQKYAGSPLRSIIAVSVMALLALLVYSAYARFIEQRAVSELSPRGAAKEWATGAVIGAGLYSLCVLVLIALGMYRIEGLNPWSYVVPAVAMSLSSGMFEELLFRGVLFKSLEDLLGSWVGLIVSSLVFGFVHLLNPAGTLLGAIYISIEAGLLLAAAFMLTRRLWLSIGFHMSWNYTQSAIFSGIVSGNRPEPGLIRSNIRGPEVLTGGSFGMESSVLAFAACTITGIVLMVMAARRASLVPPPWQRAP